MRVGVVMREPKERLLDILQAIAVIEHHLGHDRRPSNGTRLFKCGFMWHLQIIGEAARALPEGVRALASEIPWLQIIGMRSILVHCYFETDTDAVWNAAQRDIPALKPQIEQLPSKLKELERNTKRDNFDGTLQI